MGFTVNAHNGPVGDEFTTADFYRGGRGGRRPARGYQSFEDRSQGQRGLFEKQKRRAMMTTIGVGFAALALGGVIGYSVGRRSKRKRR